MIVNHPGEYFVIGTVQLYTGVNGSNAFRWDMANALSSTGTGRYLLYQDPPVVHQVSDIVLIISYVAIGIAGAVLLFLIFQTLRHRDHQVLQLSQADFLLVFLLSALLATICTFLLVPKNDVYCRISYPIIIIPIQLMYAITVGRMWRIHAVISPLLLEHLNKGRPGITQRFVQAITFVSFRLHNLFYVCARRTEMIRKGSQGAKQQISQFQLALVVTLFTLPQAILQMVTLLVQPQELIVDFNDDESVGRYTCSVDVSTGRYLLMYSLLLLFLLVIILLVMAHSSRKLPSLFNETHVIYDSTFLSLVLLLLGLAVIVLTDHPGTSPDVKYLVQLVLILSITLNPAVRIMLPKLNMVWKNETVIVSKLVTDHHRKAREKAAERGSGGGVRGSVHVSGMDWSQSRYNDSYTKGGDYDMTQTNRLMTIHSCSEAMGNGRSSFVSSEPSVNAFGATNESGNTADAFFKDKLEPETEGHGNLAVIQENPAKESSFTRPRRNGVHADVKHLDQTSATDADADSGGSGSAKGSGPTGDEAVADDTKQDGTVTFDAKQSDEGLDVEAAERKATEHKKGSFLEQRASGFLRNAMAKGLSWKIPEKSQEVEREKPQNMDKSDHRGEKTDEERPALPKKRLQKTIIVTEDETPARRLVLKMLDLQDQLEAVNNKIMSGIAVSKDDWGVITKLTSRLDRTFDEEVEFEWDIERRYEEKLEEVMPQDMSGRSWGTSSHHKRGSDASKMKGDDDRSLKSFASMKSLRLKGLMGSKSKVKDGDLGASNDSLRSVPGSHNAQATNDGPTDGDKSTPIPPSVSFDPAEGEPHANPSSPVPIPPCGSSPNPVNGGRCLSPADSAHSRGTNTSNFRDEHDMFFI